MSTILNSDNAKCPHCGNWHSGVCPRIKSIEYHPTGEIKKVEYKEEENPLKAYQNMDRSLG